MTVLAGQTIRKLGIFTPWSERSRSHGMTHGVGPAGYDVRVAEDLVIPPGGFVLASTVEHFDLPSDVVGEVKDKSTWARKGLAVQNTVVEPGWRGHLTLELSNNYPPFQANLSTMLKAMLVGTYVERTDLINAYTMDKCEYDKKHSITLKAGMPIAQILLKFTDELVEQPYRGKYQDQAAGPQAAILEPVKVQGQECVMWWEGPDLHIMLGGRDGLYVLDRGFRKNMAFYQPSWLASHLSGAYPNIKQERMDKIRDDLELFLKSNPVPE